MAWISCCWVFCWARSTCRCRCSCTLQALLSHIKKCLQFCWFLTNFTHSEDPGQWHDHHDSRTAHPSCTNRITASKASNSAELCSASLRASCSTRKAWAWGRQEERIWTKAEVTDFISRDESQWISAVPMKPHETLGLRSFDGINACQHSSPAVTERDSLGDILLLSYSLLCEIVWLLGILQIITPAMPLFFSTKGVCERTLLVRQSRNSLITCLLLTAFVVSIRFIKKKVKIYENHWTTVRQPTPTKLFRLMPTCVNIPRNHPRALVRQRGMCFFRSLIASAVGFHGTDLMSWWHQNRCFAETCCPTQWSHGHV